MAAALDVGLNHVETARGYGTSEAQVGAAWSQLPRDRFILQTKVAPRPEAAQFESWLEESFARLRTDRVELFAFHGINTRERLTHVVDGCYEVVDRFRKAGRIGHVGFSTHGNRHVIQEAIETDLFDYVNLHWYFIFQENAPALAAAHKHDMGVFIISPSDKGGHLHTPRPPWPALCAPYSPMQFNDLFCLANTNVHTLSLGAASPRDFAAHLEILPKLDAAAAETAPIAARLAEHLQKHMHNHLQARFRSKASLGIPAALSLNYTNRYLEAVPEWEELPGGVNVRKILWLHALATGWNLVPYAQSRYRLMTGNDHWFPGHNAAAMDESALRTALQASPYVDQIPTLLREAHELLRPDA